MTFEEYINVDEDIIDIIFHETPTDEEIIKTVMGTEKDEEDDDDNDDYDSETVPSLLPPLTSDAMLGLNFSSFQVKLCVTRTFRRSKSNFDNSKNS